MTKEEYIACRVLGMRICVYCFGPIRVKNRAFHCMDCLSDSTYTLDPNPPRLNHKCGVDDCWEMDIRNNHREVLKIAVAQQQEAE